ncbi:MAG: hypothetical protein J5I93_03845, partial [Pirellulaceae bacterium]|nr:hypothetical protein [Pirellulaceae bacterium]
VHASPAARDEHWQAARRAAADYLARDGSSSLALLVRVQDALVPLARGELHRQEAEVAADPQPIFETARLQLREAARLLEQADKDLALAIARTAPARDDAGQLAPGELVALQHHLRYQLGRTYRNLALCFPPASNDWLATLTAANEQLARPLAQLTADDALWWSVRLEQATCHRLLKEYREADGVLREMLDARPSDAARWLIEAEAARLLLAVGRAEQALALLAPEGRTNGEAPAEHDLARLEVLLALGQAADQAGDAERAAQWQRQAVELLASVEQRHGTYVSRRAELLLVRRGGRGASNLDVLERTAANFFRRGELDEAVATYDEAAQAATQADAPQQAFALAYKAALIEQQRQRHADAGQRFRQLARALPSHDSAARAHLLAAWNLAQAARQRPDLLAQYEQTLRDHLSLWPASDTAGQAAQWLGALGESRQEWAEALQAYGQVPAGSPQLDAALEGAARCWSQTLRQQADSGQPVLPLARQAIAWFDRLVLSDDGRLPERWSTAARRAALEAAELRLTYDPQGHLAAERMLDAAAQGPPPPDAAWTEAANQLRIVALAAQAGRAADIVPLIEQLAGGDPRRLIQVVARLDSVAADAPAARANELGRLQLQVLQQLQPQFARLPADDQLRLKKFAAQALVRTGDRAQAARHWQDLVQAQPRDGQMQEAYAQFLLDGSQTADWRQAAERWRIVASGSEKQSPRWWRAKYGLALALFKLGERQQAAERIEYLLLTTPPDSPQLKRQFDQLLAQCRSPAPNP